MAMTRDGDKLKVLTRGIRRNTILQLAHKLDYGVTGGGKVLREGVELKMTWVRHFFLATRRRTINANLEGSWSGVAMHRCLI